MTSRRRTWFLIRLAVYVIVIAVLFVVRGRVDLGPAQRLLSGASAADSTLTIAGRDLAPALVDELVASYRRDYPALAVRLTEGGTNQALEDLLNRRADVAFLYRPPTAAEQAQLRTLDGDTAVVVPVAVGGLAVVAAGGATPPNLTVAQIAATAAGGDGGTARMYAPDPNEGAWDALRQRLGLAGEAAGGRPASPSWWTRRPSSRRSSPIREPWALPAPSRCGTIRGSGGWRWARPRAIRRRRPRSRTWSRERIPCTTGYM